MKFFPIFVVSFALALVADASDPLIDASVPLASSLQPISPEALTNLQNGLRDIKYQIGKLQRLTVMQPVASDSRFNPLRPLNVGADDITELKRRFGVFATSVNILTDQNTEVADLGKITANMQSMQQHLETLTHLNVDHNVIKVLANAIKSEIQKVILRNGVTSIQFYRNVEEAGAYPMERLTPFALESIQNSTAAVKYQIGKMDYLIAEKLDAADDLYDPLKPDNVDEKDISELQRRLLLLEQSVGMITPSNTDFATKNQISEHMISMHEQLKSVTPLNVGEDFVSIKQLGNDIKAGIRKALLENGLSVEQFRRNVEQKGTFGISLLQSRMAAVKYQIGKLNYLIGDKPEIDNPAYVPSKPLNVAEEDIQELNHRFDKLKKMAGIIDGGNTDMATFNAITNHMNSMVDKLKTVTHLNVEEHLTRIKQLGEGIKAEIKNALLQNSVSQVAVNYNVEERGTYKSPLEILDEMKEKIRTTGRRIADGVRSFFGGRKASKALSFRVVP